MTRDETIRITYLLNSGFVVESPEGRWALVFDAFRDARGDVARAVRAAEEAYFFVSHAHLDHFSPEIARFSDGTRRFFLSADVRARPEARFPGEQTTWLDPYETFSDGAIRVESFSSTDEGTCFLVEKGGWRVFHAGDFNWWHWAEDTPENIGFARNGFFKQLKCMEGLCPDAAFFPADGRLGEAQAWGARAFCRAVRPRALAVMHNVGYPRFAPPEDFFEPGREIPVWSPAEPGERRTLRKGSGWER